MWTDNTKINEIIDNTKENGNNHSDNFIGRCYKICTKCGKTKHIIEYNLTQRKYKRKYQGKCDIVLYKYRRSTCKECTRKQKRDYDKKKKDSNIYIDI